MTMISAKTRVRDALRLNRRAFLRGATICGLHAAFPGISCGWSGGTEDGDTKPVKSMFLDLNRIHKWDTSNGDTWDPFWADDNSLYAFNCDGRGFGRHAMNLAFNQLSGSSPDKLVGCQVNAMADYGRAGKRGPDNATWKACGQECIDGIFYAFVSRNTYGNQSGDPLLRQTARDASLIRSKDRGRTWSRSAGENYTRPMWPGPSFGTPFFVHYGENGGQVNRDGVDAYVYACSTNGFWNDGDSLVLGRVPRNLLPRLNAADWEYYAGGNGAAASAWDRSIEQARAILSRPTKCGQTPITFVHALGVYVLISWYNTEKMSRWFEPKRMRYDFYQAPHPWGPWTQIASYDDRFLGPGIHMYGPSLCARFQESRGDEVEISMFTAGCPFEDVRESPYKIWRIPVLLRTREPSQSETIGASNRQINYRGLWFPWATGTDADPEKIPYTTLSPDASARLAFTGTGIEYLADKSKEQGRVTILLDGALMENVSLRVDDFPALLGIPVYRNHCMAGGRHIIQIVNTGTGRINIAGFRVFR